MSLRWCMFCALTPPPCRGLRPDRFQCRPVTNVKVVKLFSKMALCQNRKCNDLPRHRFPATARTSTSPPAASFWWAPSGGLRIWPSRTSPSSSPRRRSTRSSRACWASRGLDPRAVLGPPTLCPRASSLCDSVGWPPCCRYSRPSLSRTSRKWSPEE